MRLPTHHFMFLILRSTDKKHHGSLHVRFSSESKTKKWLYHKFWNKQESAVLSWYFKQKIQDYSTDSSVVWLTGGCFSIITRTVRVLCEVHSCLAVMLHARTVKCFSCLKCSSCRGVNVNTVGYVFSECKQVEHVLEYQILVPWNVNGPAAVYYVATTNQSQIFIWKRENHSMLAAG